MSTSIHGGLVRGYIPLVADGPISATTARDVLLNNSLHLADESGQVLISWAGTLGGVFDPYLTTSDDVTADKWQEIVRYENLVIPVRESGASYQLRVRVGGYSSAGHDVDFRLAVSPSSPLATTADDSAYLTGATPSTSAAWLAGVSLGTEGWPHLVALAPTQIGEPRPFPTVTDVGGAPIVGEQYRVNLTVWGRTANAASTPRLSGLYAALYIGV